MPRFRPLLVDLAQRKDNAFNGSVRTVVALHREPLTPRKEAEESHSYPDTREDLMTWEQEVKIKGKREGRLEGRQEGISLGQLREKQDVLIRTMEDSVRLDTALDEILFAESKDSVLRKLGAHE